MRLRKTPGGRCTRKGLIIETENKQKKHAPVAACPLYCSEGNVTGMWKWAGEGGSGMSC